MGDSWTPVLIVLAVVGALALIYRLMGSILALGLSAAEEATASGLANVSERRGDLTGLAERREHQARARSRRRRALGLGAVWALWLAIPIFGGWLPEGYAPASVLWLFAPRSTRITIQTIRRK